MSKQGKAIAASRMAIGKAKSMRDMDIFINAMVGPARSIIGCPMVYANKVTWDNRIDKLAHTPHQYFNDAGKIDKRKKRKHDRKQGIKVHTSRIVRPKIGRPPHIIGIDMANGEDLTETI